MTSKSPSLNFITTRGPAVAARLHQSAMRMAYEGLDMYRDGHYDAARGMLRAACKLELDAASHASDTDSLPRAILCRSAAILALQAGAVDDAARLAGLCLRGVLPVHVANVMGALVDATPEVSDVRGRSAAY